MEAESARWATPGIGRSGALVAWLVTLLVSVLFYHREEAWVHFVWHLGYGAAAGLVAAAAFSLTRKTRPRGVAWWALGGYLFMIIPDLIWLAPTLWGGEPVPHAPWMNVFLAHTALDHWEYTSVFLLPAVAVAGLTTSVAWARTRAGASAAE